ncbi:MAG: matrixin family metalloprotease [Acidobacteria bacterium]|nr:matrixin family metalloprotease [Acidobacteriota bacterium]
MRKRITSICLIGLLVLSNALPALAGGALETQDITGNVPSPIAGHIIAKLVGIKWDARSIPVRYSMNTSLDPIPNPLGAPFLTLAAAQAALQVSFDQWNNIPTSFIDMRITGSTGKTTLAGFDFINELTFRTSTSFSAIASSPSVSLIVDATFADGDDIDGDGDSDVSSAITAAQDVDNDGDIEFPAGFYKAGTILDNDVQFNTKTSNGFRFTLGAANMDIVTRSVDLNTVATHEFGHSHGLAHSMDNQTGINNGDGATMFPFIDTGDPAAELAQATLAQDDISWSSYFYPEGTASSGPAALQSGDKAFSSVFGLITGEVRHGVLDQPIAGASVFAVDWVTGDVVASGYSGTTQLSRSLSSGGLFFVNQAFNILDGKYVIPVPKGSYAVGIEPVDGTPAAASNISLTCQIGAFFGQQNFAEEFWNNNSENSIERRIGQRKQIPIQPGKTQKGINFITPDIISISNFGNRNFIGFTNVTAGFMYAIRIPGSQIAAINPGQDVAIQGISFDTNVTDASVAPVFAQATLATGVVNPDNTITVDLANPLETTTGFLGQDNDFATFYFHEPHVLGRKVRSGIADGSIQNLFIVLQVPTVTPFAGVSGQPPFIGLGGGAILGQSFTSNNGGATWALDTRFNFRFSLVLSQPATPPGQ